MTKKMSNTDYSFMKSGFNNLITNDEPNQELIINISSLITTFLDKALEVSSIYISHANRKIITPKDIKISLKNECFNFLNRNNINDDVLKWKQIIENEIKNNEQENDDYYSDSDTESLSNKENPVIEEYKISNCKCELCNNLNNIDIKWNNWKPSNNFEIILKKCIDKVES